MILNFFLELNAIVCLLLLFFVANLNCRNLSLLSFGEEAEEEEKELAVVKKKIVSSHDVLNDPRLLKDENANNELVIRPFL